MTPFARTAALSVAVGLMAGPALSAITAVDLWTEWQRMAADQGKTLAVGAQAPRKDGIDLSGFTLIETADGATVTTTLDTVRLTNIAEGVRVLVPGGQNLTIETLSADLTETTAVFSFTAGDLTLVASGDLPVPNYTVSARSFSVNLNRLEEDGVVIPGEFALGVSDLRGELTNQDEVQDAETQSAVLLNLTASAMTLTIDATEPTSGQRATLTSAISDVAVDATLHPGTAGAETALSGVVTSGASQSSLRQIDKAAGNFQAITSQGKGRMSVEIANGRAAYDTTLNNLTATVSSDKLTGGPVTLAMTSANAALSLPTSAESDPATAHLTANLTDVRIDEKLWSQVDPGQILPRSPAQLRLDLDADMAFIDDAQGTATPRPENLRVNDLSVSFADATLDASGGFSFPANPAAGTPVPGMAGLIQPVGQLDLILTGGMTLLQRLTEAGLVTAQQAMSTQMIMSMFAIPGDDDSLTSTIVTEPDGGLTVNGTKLR